MLSNYNTLKNLKWTKKGIYLYISYIIRIIKVIVSHPIYRSLKYIFNILLIFEGLLIVIYYTYLPLSIGDLYDTNKTLIEIYRNVLRYIRDKLNLLLNEQVISQTEDLEMLLIETDKSSSESNVNKSYIKWFSIITIVIVSGIVIYYNPDMLNYFKDIDNDSDLLGSSIPNSPAESHYFKDPNSPTNSEYFNDLSELTPKASASKVLTSDNQNSVSN